MMSWERNFIQNVNYMFDIKPKKGILKLRQYFIDPVQVLRNDVQQVIEQPLFF